jgi:hypothetical protein
MGNCCCDMRLLPPLLRRNVKNLLELLSGPPNTRREDTLVAMKCDNVKKMNEVLDRVNDKHDDQ